MSILKLLFDLPDAREQCDFTIEEQEDLIAFEQKLEQEGFVANFNLQDGIRNTQLAFLRDDDGSGGTGDAKLESNEVQTLEGLCNVNEIQNGFLGKGRDGGSLQEYELQSLHLTVTNEIPNGFVKEAEEDGGALRGYQEGQTLQLPIERCEVPTPQLENNEDHQGNSLPVTTADQLTQIDSTQNNDGGNDESGAKCMTTSAAAHPTQVPEELTLPPNEQTVSLDDVKKTPTSMKHAETGNPLWIKWRGKWQSAIQCSVNDCRVATVKSKPTKKKQYILVYLVCTRMYLWLDAQNVCTLTENPLPLVSGSHVEWREMVADTGAPRRRLFLGLGWDMLDISDRLHILGVIERARCVEVWKGFVKEATEAHQYSDLGFLLVRIHAVIEPLYVSDSWVERRFRSWTQECSIAVSAQTIEKLTKELIKAILWDKAASLWSIPMQAELEEEWADWKGNAFDEIMDADGFTHGLHIDPCAQASTSSSPSTAKREQVNNNTLRSSLRRSQGSELNGKVMGQQQQQQQQPQQQQQQQQLQQQKQHQQQQQQQPQQPQPQQQQQKQHQQQQQQPQPQQQQPQLQQQKQHQQQQPQPQHQQQKQHQQQQPQPQLQQQKQHQQQHQQQNQHGMTNLTMVTLPPGSSSLNSALQSSSSPPSALHSSSKRKVESPWACSAYLKSTKRRCSRQARIGIYCQKHQGLAENPPTPQMGRTDDQHHHHLDDDAVPSFLCMARLDRIENRRCPKPVIEGSVYCDLHITNTPFPVPDLKVPASLLLKVPDGEDLKEMEKDKAKRLDYGRRTSPPWCSEDDQCLQQQKHGSKPQKDSSSAGGGGGIGGKMMRYCETPIAPKDDALGIRSSKKDTRNLLKAQDLLCRFLTTGMEKERDGVKNCSKLLDAIVEEATKDAQACETLLKILSVEKERLHELVIQQANMKEKMKFSWSNSSRNNPVLQTIATSPHHGLEEQQTSAIKNPPSTSSSQMMHKQQMIQVDAGFGFTCSLCDGKFEHLSILGKHWMDQHKREAYRFQKCLTCRLCRSDFADRVQLLSHWKAAHPSSSLDSISSSSSTSVVGWSVCVVCDKQFMSFDHLWQHIEDQHPLQWSNSSTEFSAQIGGSTFLVDDPLAKKKCTPDDATFSTQGKVPHCEKMIHNSDKGLQDCNNMSLRNMKSEEVDTTADSKLKWRHRARAKAKKNNNNITRVNVVPMKNQSSGILQRMKQVLEDRSTNVNSVSTRKQQAEGMQKSCVSSQTNAATPALKYQCRLCGLRFPLLPDLGRHHQEKHLTVKQAFITNGLGEPETGLYTLSKDGVLMQSSKSDKLVSARPNSKEILDIARFACCKAWLYKELRKKYVDLSPRFCVQAAHLCSVAKVEIRWHKDGYVCPEGCKEYRELLEEETVPPLAVDMIGLSLRFCAVDASADHGTGMVKSTESVINTSHTMSTNPKSLVLLEDLSNGQEQVPIVCMVDRDVMEPCSPSCSLCAVNANSRPDVDDVLKPWDTFVYSTKRLLDPSLGLDTKDSQLGCSCGDERCSPHSCDHVSMFDNDNTEAHDIHGQLMHGRFPYDSFGRIIVEEGYMIYECNSSCWCQEDCENRVLQNGVRVKLEVFKSRHKGWGVRAGEFIPRGTFVCEYIGEVLNDQEANKRGERYDQVGCSYLYDIDAHLDISGSRSLSKPFVIDATKYGNVARFINHSCAPNLINYEVLVESMDCQLAHIGFFANQDIAIGEELAYNYRYKLLRGKGCPCHCGAPSCRGRLY